jgi:hypothetical protein
MTADEQKTAGHKVEVQQKVEWFRDVNAAAFAAQLREIAEAIEGATIAIKLLAQAIDQKDRDDDIPKHE